MGKRRVRAAGSRLRDLGLLLLALVLPWGSPHAQETVCAVVKIEIRQELTLERQAFQARMKITNGLDTLALENVSINVLFQDEAGNSVPASSDPNSSDALFFIRVDTMDGISDISGNGHIPPNGVAEITWLIIPTTGAGGTSPTGKLYGVGATLEYRFGGDAETVNVAPDVIRVKPTPVLTLDYFLPRDVFGNDPMTPEVEEPEPFDLGVRITNSGAGDARALKIESAQPRIVENNQGLLVDFLLHGTSVDDQPVQNTLLADFGTLLAGRTKVARWVMTSSLTGTFISFEADYIHSDELGGQLTSLIHDIRTHELVWSVKNDMPGRDNVRDFLVRAADGYRIMESDGVDADVVDRSGSASLTTLSPVGGVARYQLSFPATQTPHFAAVTDPNPDAPGTYSAWRSDGKRIDAANVWRFRRPGASGGYTRHIGLFDVASTGSYELRFDGEVQQNAPPQIDEVAPLSVPAGTPIELTITASDPDGDTLTLTAGVLPPGATFSDLGQGAARFEWLPTRAHIGTHAVRVYASDGQVSVYRDLSITVTPSSFVDTDGDGMDDDWEIEHFGDLSRDGTGDYDLDGATDLEEFLHGGNPTVEDRPGTPAIVTPAAGAVIADGPLEFAIANAERAELAQVAYRFELYSDAALRDLVAAAEVAEGSGETRWSPELDLAAGKAYIWRVRAHDGATPGNWAYGHFQVSGGASLPEACAVASPRDEEVVGALRPRLAVRVGGVAADLPLRYRIEVYHDAALSDLAAQSPLLERAAGSELSWRVYPALVQGEAYHWRAVLVGQGGSELACPGGGFAIDSSNAAPSGYSLAMPGDAGRVEGDTALLLASGAEDAEGDVIALQFELDSEPTFDSPDLRASEALEAFAGAGQWQVDGLMPATRYHARVRAGDGHSFGDWRYVAFHTAATAADLAQPSIRNPHPASWIETPTPRLEVAAVPHPAPDRLGYRFELYADEALTDPLATALGGAGVVITQPLQDRLWYWWRARAEDGDASGDWSEVARFFVIDNGFDDLPQFEWLHPGHVDTVTRPGSELLRWTVYDPDSVAMVDLYYQLDGEEGAPVPIASELAEDQVQSFLWDTSAFADGDYRLHAVVRDASSTVTRHAQGMLRLRAPALRVEGEDRVTGEDGRSVSLAVSLTAMPDDLVIVPAGVTRPDEARVEPVELVFSPANWNQPQTLTVIGLDDQVQDGDQPYAVTLGPADSDDSAYTGMEALIDGFVNEDDDIAAILIDADLPLITSEDGAAAEFTVRLGSQPTAPVRLRWQVSDPSEGRVYPESLLFDADNWHTPQAMRVEGVDDLDVDGDIEYLVFVSAIESDDAIYAALEPPLLPAINLDNEQVMILVSPAGGVEVDESGSSATLQVTVNGPPRAEVRIGVASSDLTAGVVAPAEVIIAPDDWDEPRQIVVTGVDDGVPAGDRVFAVQFGPVTSADARFHGLGVPDVRVVSRELRLAGIEVGLLDADTWMPGEVRQVPLAPVFGQAPLVFPQWTSHDPEPLALRLRQVTAEAFEVVLVRPEGSAAVASSGRLSFLAVEPGVHRLPDGREFVAGRVETMAVRQGAEGSWSQVAFPVAFQQRPLVLTQIQSSANETDPAAAHSVPWLTVAVGQVSATGIGVALERSETIQGEVSAAEVIGYFAIGDGAQGRFPVPGGAMEYEARRQPRAAVGIEQGCRVLPFAVTRAAVPVVFGGLMSRSDDDGGWLRSCAVGHSTAAFAIDEDVATDAERSHSEETLGLMLFDRPFHAELVGAPAGVRVSPRFGLRTFAQGLGTGFGLSLSDRPVAAMTLSLSAPEADGLRVLPASVTFTPENWTETRWVRVEALAGDARSARIALELDAAGDPRYAVVELPDVVVAVGAADAWASIVDSDGADFSALGGWQTSTESPGYHGADYLIHPAGSGGPVEVIVDNRDAGFSRVGEWHAATELPGYYGSDYEYRHPGDPFGTRIVDDPDATLVGPWTAQTSGSGYYGDGYHTAPAGDGSATATWRFPAIADGDYQVYARWSQAPNRANNAAYQVRHVGGSTVVRANQRGRGGQWVPLGTFRLDALSSVVLSNAANGVVVADAVRIVPVNGPPNSVAWSAALPVGGIYDVHARWTAHGDHAPNARYLVQHAEGETEVRANQKNNGGTWVSLGSYPFVAGQPARVVLTDQANGIVIADAVRFVSQSEVPGEALWSLNGQALGRYWLSAQWPAAEQHAHSAPLRLVAADADSTHLVDQTKRGGEWVPLASVLIAPEHDAFIQLSAIAESAVVADAMRAVDGAAFGPPGALILDDSQAALEGDWNRLAMTAGAFDGGHRTATAGEGEATASWVLPLHDIESHRIYARWPADATHAADAPFAIEHVDGSDVVRVDQRDQGGQWRLLGTYRLGPGSVIHLSNDAGGTVAADAIRIEPARYPAGTP